MGESRDAYTVWMERIQGKIALGGHKRRRENNIKIDLQQVGYGGRGMDWIDMAQDKDKWRAFVIGVMNPQFLLNAGIFLTS